jgi:hypothetical protein
MLCGFIFSPHHHFGVDVVVLEEKKICSVDSSIGWTSRNTSRLEKDSRVEDGSSGETSRDLVPQAKGFKDIVTISLQPPDFSTRKQHLMSLNC